MAIDSDETSELLKARMRRLRNRLDREVDVVVDNASNLLDWRYYVRKYPLTTVGLATLVAYHLVPKKIRTKVTIDDSAVQEIMSQNDSKPVSQPSMGGSLIRSLVETSAHAALRTALAIGTRKLVSQAIEQSSSPKIKDDGPIVSQDY